MTPLWRSELALFVAVATLAIFLLTGSSWLADANATPVLSIVLFVWLFGVMLWSSFSVVRHAEALAQLLGEPLGTLILTLSVIGIEVVMISSIMLMGDNNPSLARETMFGVLMIVMNLLVGLTLLLGGLKHHEQTFNLQGANAYLAVILPLAALGLILPSFTTSTEDASASTLLGWFLGLACVVLYGIFLGIQTMRHRGWFLPPKAEDPAGTHDFTQEHPHMAVRSVKTHAILLVATMVPIVLLAKFLAQLLDVGIESAGLPAAAAGLVVALLVLTPEGLGAIRSAWNNQLTRSVNLCLGSALATIGLTIPAVLAVAAITGRTVELGLQRVDMLLLVVTLAVSMITFGSGRTNVLQGAVHLVLFFAYVVLIFDF
jgi:Ca2+:H+ antiporter